MSRMFGERIKEFVLLIDIMDQELFFDLLKLIQMYVRKHLNVAYFSVLSEGTVDNQPGINTLWSTRGEEPSYSVGNQNGYISHSAYTFGEKKPIWVVSDSKKPLQTADDVKDMWSHAKDLPRYSTLNREPVRTSVMLPLMKESRAIGVVEFAAARYIEPTPASLDEAKTLAKIISRAYQMYDVRRDQHQNSEEAIQMLEVALRTESWTRLALPQLFVAYPSVQRLGGEARTQHKAVIDIIKSVVDEFKVLLIPVYWDEVKEAGSITEQVIRDIGNSELGLCYFSEPTSKGCFRDNPNVLFEAGMMQALTNSPNAPLRAWIAVREDESMNIPFDIKDERVLRVNRENGTLNENIFADALRQRLKALVEILGHKGYS